VEACAHAYTDPFSIMPSRCIKCGVHPNAVMHAGLTAAIRAALDATAPAQVAAGEPSTDASGGKSHG
jgi:hypothetical protein